MLGVATLLAAAALGVPSPLIFPVLGPVTYTNDFGQPRPGGPHQGNDLIAPRKAIAVAAEGGTVKFWTTSKNAGCLLYLYGESGTTYIYIHLNNDLGSGNDNKGSCVAGVAFASGLHDGDYVGAGEPVGFVGDSGDANGIHPHLHFEVHPRGGKAVSPYRYLQTAEHVLFSATAGTTFTLALTGTVLDAAEGTVTLATTLVRQWPAHERVAGAGPVTVSAPPELAAPAPGQRVTIWTAPAPANLDAELGFGLTAAKIAVLASAR